MSRLRAVLAALMGTVLVLGLIAPSAQARDHKVWVSGTGVADLSADACPDQNPDAGVVASVFTSDRGENRGLNGCWYFDFGEAEQKQIALPGGRTKLLEYPDEWFVGTLNGQDVSFATAGAVVVTLWEGEPYASTQIAGGCWHPLDPADGSGALVFIEQLDEDVPTVRYYGRIAVG